MQYAIRRIEKNISIEELMAFYKPIEVEGYCESCPNYNKIWSCPPHDFDREAFLAPYSMAKIIGEVITPEQESELLDCFQKARRVLGDALIPLSETGQVEVLIAGNCYQCETCTRGEGTPCSQKSRCKYSLESIGFMVGEIAENVLNEPLSWGCSDDRPKTLMTVAAVLY